MVYRIDAGTWTEIYERYENRLLDLQAYDSEHAWVLRTDGLYYWNDNDWQRIFVPDEQYGSNETIGHLEVLDPEHIWITTSERLANGLDGNEEGEAIVGRVYFYNGDSWACQSEVQGACELLAIDPQHIWAWAGNRIYLFEGESWALQYEASTEIETIEAKDYSFACAIGMMDESGLVRSILYSFDGSQWLDQGMLDYRIKSIQILDAENAWAGGSRYNPNATVSSKDESAIFFWDGESWEEQFKEGGQLKSLYASETGLLWAEFRDKVVLYEGRERRRRLYGMYISDLAVADDQNAWCIKSDDDNTAALYFYNGSGWEKIDVPYVTYSPWASLFALDASHVWVEATPKDTSNEMGGGLTSASTLVQFFNGAEWIDQFKLDGNISTFVAPDAKRIWAYGSDGLYMGVREP